jgi:hypothetical protein
MQDWLQSGNVAFNHGHSSADLRALVAVTNEQREHLLEVWNEHFGN